MGVASIIHQVVTKEIATVYQVQESDINIQIQETRAEFTGDYTVVLFALTRLLRQSPENIGKSLGESLVANHPSLFSGFEVIKGFLNLSVSDRFWLDFLKEFHDSERFGRFEPKGRKIMVEYSSPNTNKPLHLGHLRNIFLGWSLAEILSAYGYEVVKTCVVNDRGVHICKSMLAWQKFGNGATPETAGMKGDHLVGDYYVKFEEELKKQEKALQDKLDSTGDYSIIELEVEKLRQLDNKLKEETHPEKIAEIKGERSRIIRNNTPIMKEVREMLVKWEKGDAETLNLWRQMNNWVYDGFAATYQKIGADFHKIYYESDTYLLGKKYVEEGLEKGIFYKKPDGSVWIDLTADGLDEKLVLRSDGTSVYITQDLGLAQLKYEEYAMDESIYVIGDEQNYHMKVLKLICRKLNLPNAENIYHLSYGMVELPHGRMKSREGTVVDADDIVSEMEKISEQHTRELGKVDDFSEESLKELNSMIGIGALKFFLLRVDPKKKMIFNPEESIDFHGFTGPFIQYAYARTKSILRKESPKHAEISGELLTGEKKLIKELEKYPDVIETAAREKNPSEVAVYAFKLAQALNSFVAEHRILQAESEEKKELRLQIAGMTANVLKSAMSLLGIAVPERM